MGSNQTWSSRETRHLVWLLFGPALKVRERLINDHIFNRTISALTCLAVALEKNQKGIMKALVAMYDLQLFQKTELSDTL